MDITPPRYCDFLEEELVVGDAIKTLDLHLRATRVSSAAYLIAFILGLPVIVYTGSLIFPK